MLRCQVVKDFNFFMLYNIQNIRQLQRQIFETIEFRGGCVF
ncbi:hypothetical protein NC99_18320 [Sunxiuqinia dokdonensis]|uniref:Uncharacterized protein n=1 Tax=Sunxiuqinia dokdonensis TaxID=1409788 RepID=A0A0L8VA54_9BACT|nr:hypothetical protein NC99_18320 [Sunxiuqinia dokdonensis]